MFKGWVAKYAKAYRTIDFEIRLLLRGQPVEKGEGGTPQSYHDQSLFKT